MFGGQDEKLVLTKGIFLCKDDIVINIAVDFKQRAEEFIPCLFIEHRFRNVFQFDGSLQIVGQRIFYKPRNLSVSIKAFPDQIQTEIVQMGLIPFGVILSVFHGGYDTAVMTSVPVGGITDDTQCLLFQ